jgi:cobalt/nickel transport protein
LPLDSFQAVRPRFRVVRLRAGFSTYFRSLAINCWRIIMKCPWLLAALVLAATPTLAHFGTITPSDDIVTQKDSRTLNLQLKFIHPLEQHYMEMVRPQQFGVLHQGKKTDLRDTLKATQGKSLDQVEKFTYWTADYQIRRPGDYTFYVEPSPYWEPAEDLFIVHYTKVCVGAFGLEKGWDEPVGLETEIIPMTRPYGLWTNNLFTGQVLLRGQPVPFAEVEVEYLNESPGNLSIIQPPSGPFVTQVVKADANGVFSYAMPKAGWWGFSALNEADRTIAHEGVEKNIEIGAVYWVHTRDMR